MNDPTPIRALIYKDTRLVSPLVILALLCNVVFYALLFLLWKYWDLSQTELEHASISIWILMPGLLVFGAPSMLVGTEEESGTLKWLRTLPVSWQQVAYSKLLVGFSAFVLAWTLSTFLLWLSSVGWKEDHRFDLEQTQRLHIIAFVVFSQALLLLLGFAAAYRICNPLVALLLLFPLFFLILWVFVLWIAQFQLAVNGMFSAGAFISGIAFLLIAGMLQHEFARRRLTSVQQQRGASPGIGHANSRYYQPPTFDESSQPSQSAILLWQQFRQTSRYAIGMIVISWLTMCLFLATRNQPARIPGVMFVFGATGPMFMLLSASWLGALVFHADNQQRRYEFFADRGISPSKIWWTRITPLLIACVVLIALPTLLEYLIAPSRRTPFDPKIGIMAVVLFAFGQLVSQWIRRPLLAFFAAPAFAFLCLLPIIYFYDGRDRWIYSSLLSIPILFFASWRLTKRWLEGHNDELGYAVRLVGYTFLAVTSPGLLIAGAYAFRYVASRL